MACQIFIRQGNECDEHLLTCCLLQDSGSPAGPKDGDDAGTQATLQKGGAVRMMGVRIQEQLLGELGDTTQHMDNPPPATKRGRAPVRHRLNCKSDDSQSGCMHGAQWMIGYTSVSLRLPPWFAALISRFGAGCCGSH